MNSTNSVFSVAAVAFSLVGSASGGVIFDQIDALSGTTGEGITSQFFEPALSSFNTGVLDDFSVTGGNGTLTGVDVVMKGQNGFTSLSNVTSWTVQIYSSPASAGTSLVGDVASASGVSASWASFGSGPDRFLVSLDLSSLGMSLADGDYWISVIATMPFTNGQVYVMASGTDGGPGPDKNGKTANPGLGFGQGAISSNFRNWSYRISAVPAPGAIALLGIAGVARRGRRQP